MSLTRYNQKQQKLCSVPRCPIVIDRVKLMCLGHWRDVPTPVRNRVVTALAAWRRNMADADALMALQQAQAEAIGLVS